MNFHAGLKANPLGNTALFYLTHNWCHGGKADNTQQPVSEDRKQEVGNRTCGRNGNALARRLGVERLALEILRHWSFTLIQHFHITTKRYGGHGKFGSMAVVPGKQGLAKAHGKPEHLHATAAGNPEMTVFVQCHQYAER